MSIWPVLVLTAGAWAYGAALVAEVLGLIRRRTYFAVRMWTDAAILVCEIAVLIHDGLGIFFWLAAVAAGSLWWDHRMWRKCRDDDDDDLGKRLRSWARSHLPRPELIRIRPIEQATG
jgi:hypothetical protein